MSNVIGVANEPDFERLIRNMKPREVGYTVPWAWDKRTRVLNEDFHIGAKGGTYSLRVECVEVGLYSLTFEEPIYRSIGEIK